MLTDPLYMYAIAESLNIDNGIDATKGGIFRLIDLAPSKSVRRCSSFGASELQCDLTISQTLTNENAPYGTDRTLIRLDAVLTDAPTGKLLKGSCYLVVALPKTIDWKPDSSNIPGELVKALATFLLAEENPIASTDHLVTPSTYLPRILVGEP